MVDGAGTPAKRRRVARPRRARSTPSTVPAVSANSSNASHWSMTAIRSRGRRPRRANDAAYLQGPRISGRIHRRDGRRPVSRTCARGDNVREIEEERRLCYVGMTRAQRLLYLTNASVARTVRQARRSRAPRASCRSRSRSLAADRARSATRRRYCVRRRASPTSITPTASCPTTTRRAGDTSRWGRKVQHQTFGHGVVSGAKGAAMAPRYGSTSTAADSSSWC